MENVVHDHPGGRIVDSAVGVDQPPEKTAKLAQPSARSCGVYGRLSEKAANAGDKQVSKVHNDVRIPD